ncbi:hypothetical protein C900_01171 [Fulvivirga imtechensis AK7]|uniref:Outer membrane protein beta-barrel domain-containing protein n=1 Tax=Fulvivirga imtechensis AK7 TaxID=1237149 RepID=L8JKZ9_9BACT|nr:hypothetical protein [Fulvivirga imtechensis]ELR68092.1 hypothetical protein C900_01171 [Fulvivirga imtechensis AK7]
MKTTLLVVVITMGYISAIAQDEYLEDKYYRRDEIKTLSGSGYHSGGFAGLTFKKSDFEQKVIMTAGFRGGWIINRSLAIGLEGHGLIPTAEFDDILPGRTAVLLGGYGGMFLEPILFSNQVVHVTFPIAGGAGWLGLHDDWEENDDQYDELIDDDVFWYLEPGVALEINIARHFRLCLGMSKRFTQDLKLFTVDAKEFENLNYFVTLKFGRF